MTALPRRQGLARFLERLRALLNLNDPGWGRDAGAGQSSGGARGGNGSGGAEQGDAAPPPPPPPPPPMPPRPPAGPQGGPRGGQQQPPDLSELMGDLNRKLSKLLGSQGGRRPPGGPRGGMPGGFKPPSISGGLVSLVAVVLLGLWLASGFFVVQEGHNAVILRFGKYQSTVPAGLRYRLPSPIGSHEIVDMRIQPLAVGSNNMLSATGLNEHAMLTKDENIVEVRFNVQYRITNAENWKFNAQNPQGALVSAAETAVREVIGDMTMDEALANRRAEIAPGVREIMQEIVDRYRLGVTVVAINMQDSGVLPPESVRAAFDDVLRADQERERAKNDAEAYANRIIPRAVGEAARIKEEAQGYRLRVMAESEGDAARFSAVLGAYRQAPAVTRERMYLETMEEIYKKSSKVLLDGGDGGNNLVYLPLDKLMEQSAAAAVRSHAAAAEGTASAEAASAPAAPSASYAPAAPQGTRRPSRESR
ncbi:FtsH protease activity modulator HflK [Vandammella animalimorsus]|uniref:Protein HflK n=1 Tax=Vandammella animalimorsus TaxID=2029117 RepID=A0A2A2A9W0_9BURK|nr:FtsH protease activity modulator HflK [Vandammella animalimorsus]PAT34528.1 FtsH protease activity modulator HflK [Vandammella animalimorsus]